MQKSQRALSFDLSRNLYIEHGQLQLERSIGHGSFGSVWLARLDGHDRPVAFKRVNCPIEEEGMILQAVSHPNIVQYLGVVHEPPANFGLVMEYAENGSLSHYIHSSPAEISGDRQDSIVQQVLAGMLHLHYGANFPIIHRDLKPHNILLTNNHTVAKLADFGCARVVDEGTATGSNRGSLAYMAPELIREEGRLSRSSDVYSFGVVLWELFTRTRPFQGKNEAQIIYYKGEGKSLPLDVQGIGPGYRSLLASCFSADRKKRPSFRQIDSNLNFNLSPSSSGSTGSVFSLPADGASADLFTCDNSRLAWLVYGANLPPRAEWSPSGRDTLAVLGSATEVLLLDVRFIQAPPVTDSTRTASSSLGVTLAHRNSITGFKWSREGSCLAVATSDGRVWLWTSSGTLLRRVIVTHTSPIRDVQWNYDSTLISCTCDEGGSESLKVIWLENDFKTSEVLTLEDTIKHVAWSIKKHDLLVCCTKHQIHIVRLETFCKGCLNISKDSAITHVLWAASSLRLLVATSSVLRVFSVQLGDDTRFHVKPKVTMKNVGDIKDVSWHPKDDDRVVFTNGTVLYVLNAEEKTSSKLFNDERAQIESLSFNPDGQIIAMFDQARSAIALIQWKTGSQLSTIPLTKHDSLMSGVRWNCHGGRLAAGVRYAKNELNLFDHALLIVDLASQFSLHCVIMQSPQTIRTIMEVSEVADS